MLPLNKSCAHGGTLVLWRKCLDPFINILPSPSPAILPILCQIPGIKISVHICIYLPTHGRDADFLNELANLQLCVEDIKIKYNQPAIFIRGDANSSKKNIKRFSIFSQFLQKCNLLNVHIPHPTYHHFVGNGLFDSNVDVLTHSNLSWVYESILKIFCTVDLPDVSSHHDMIMSNAFLPPSTQASTSVNLKVAPRTTFPRYKINWTETGVQAFSELAAAQLCDLRESWEPSSSKSLSSLLIQFTNNILVSSATATNSSSSTIRAPNTKKLRPPISIRKAKKKLNRMHEKMAVMNSPISRQAFKSAQKAYRAVVRKARLDRNLCRDAKMDEILSSSPKAVYSYIRNIRGIQSSQIECLDVNGDAYTGNMVGDGFFHSMSSLKQCDEDTIGNDPNLKPYFENYEHILRICEKKADIQEISYEKALSLLKRLKANVMDIYGITPLHYLNAGVEGIQHFQFLLNIFIRNVNNSTVSELNTALGMILYKGHQRDKNSDRSYRNISTCPLVAKGLDLHLRDQFQCGWNEVTADTQYQRNGSSHELASLLVTETIQFSLNVNDKPMFLLILDAQSAFDRCLRQILCTELFMTGMKGSSLLLVDNRLKSRNTVYQWNGEMLGPSRDITGFEQGGINSGDFYKLYNNEQLYRAQNSCLGVDIKSSTVSAIGQADDVILVSDDIFNLKLLVRLTLDYCANYRVKLVPSKIKLLPVYHKRHLPLVDYAEIVNSISIDDTDVQFVTQAEHVGVIRSCHGNMENIQQRIINHKKSLAALGLAGVMKSSRTNPASSLRMHKLYAEPVLFSGVASVVLLKSELKVLQIHHKNTLQALQRLHPNTPRAVVYLLGGCLPAEAVLHARQLSLFMMICHRADDPLHRHGIFILGQCKANCKSWFFQIQDICLKYRLPHPLTLLASPPPKLQFKALVKKAITKTWQIALIEECQNLQSLKYFRPELYSLTNPHHLWTTAARNPFETAKAMVLAQMISGRYRSEMFCRHFSKNRHGYCSYHQCIEIEGTLEHILATCPAYTTTRERLFMICLEKTVMFPSLHQTIREVLASNEEIITKFFLEPISFPEVYQDFHTHGHHYAQTLSYLSRTFVFGIHREYQKRIKSMET